MSASNYLENKIRDHINGVATYTPPATVYFGLHTANPGEAGTIGEVTGGAYARASLLNSSTGFNAAVSGAATNALAVQFPDATANWGTISFYSKWDALTAGNCLEYGALTANKIISSGDPGPRFNAASLSESVD